MKTIIALLTFLVVPFALAAETHQHILTIFDARSHQKLTIYTPEEGDVSRVVVSKPQASGDDKILMNAEISSQQVSWSLAGDPQKLREPFRGFAMNLGRSGQVKAVAAKAGNCQVSSTMREFAHPKAVLLSCSYFYARGPKPGFSGSN